MSEPAEGPEDEERETMRIMLRATMAALSLASIGSASAGEGEGTHANTLFTEIPGVVAQAPVRNVPPAASQNGQAIHVYGIHSRGQGTWLFAPDQTGGGSNG
jgi:hypothetical protein